MSRADGRPIRKRRYAFSESFAAIAYGELAKATGDDAYAEKARRTFQSFIDHNLNPETRRRSSPTRGRLAGIGFPMITIVTAQELRDSIGLAEANRVDRPQHRDDPRFSSQAGHRVRDGNGRDRWRDHRSFRRSHFESWACDRRRVVHHVGGNASRRRLAGPDGMPDARLDVGTEAGTKSTAGSCTSRMSTVHPVQEYWHDMKFWWPHNEAIIATLLAYHLTGDPRYASWHQQVHDWAYRHFPDPEHGEWFGYLDRTGRVTSTLKGNLWKGPFHLPRMQLFCSRILAM